jgi:hypothetical protein
MKKEEAQVLRHDIVTLIEKKGMPINTRKGTNTDVAEWAAGIFDKCVQIDEPLGTANDHCPVCKKTVGTSGAYCKWCGAFLREVRWL